MNNLLQRLSMLTVATTLLAVNAATVSAQTTWVVTSTADDGGGDTLRNAIAAAQSGDTIVFDPSLDGQTIVLTNGPLVIDQSLDIEGPGADLLAISGNRSDTVIKSSGTGPVTITGLTIRDGASTTYYSGSTPYVGGGSGIRNSVGLFPDDIGESLTLRNCIITGNSAQRRAGGIYNAGRLTISGCIITGNHADMPDTVAWSGSESFGGGLYNDSVGSVTIADSIVSDNRAWGGEGGGIYNGGLMDISNSSVSDNYADYDGGGIYNGYGQDYGYWEQYGYATYTPTLTMSNSTVSGNGVPDARGGGIANAYGTVTLYYCSVTGNTPYDTEGTIVVVKGKKKGGGNNK